MARLVVCVAAVLLAHAACSESRSPRLILISIDGLMPFTYQAADSPAVTIRRLAAEGAWASGVTGVWPTNTWPSHATLLTGVPPAAHGIADNQPLDPEGRRNRTFNWFAGDLKVPTILDAAGAAGRSTAIVMWPLSIGAAADHRVPAFEWTHPRDHRLLRALATPGLIEEFERAAGRPIVIPADDRERTELTTFIARTYRPDLLLLYYGTLDAYQHTYGVRSEQTLSTLRAIDSHIGEMLTALESEGLLDNAYIAIVSDHGYVEVQHALAPNAAFRQAGLIDIGEDGRISRWQAYSNGSGGSSLVYLNDRSDRKLADRVRGILEGLQADPQSGIARVLGPEELEAAQAETAAAFGLEMRLGYSLTEDLGSVHGRPYIHSMHGYPPTHREMDASLVISGPGLAGKGNLGMVRMTQVAPTIARLLGVALPSSRDVPIDAVVEAAK